MRKKEKQEKSLVAFVSGDELPKDIVHPDFGKEETKAKKIPDTIDISLTSGIAPIRSVTWDGDTYRTYVDYTYDDSYITTSRWYFPRTGTLSF